MRSDPSDTGGLFLGRRPGTAPTHFRRLPERGSAARQRVDGYLAGAMLAGMILLSLLCWGPIPIACLWLGAQVDYLSGSVSLGILVAFVALFVLLFGALRLMRSLDEGWILVRRAAGHDQRSGTLGRVFATTAIICAVAFGIWFMLIHGPGQMVESGNAK
jgi:predicted secreted protein